MKKAPKMLTDREFAEIARFLFDDNGEGFEGSEEMEEEIRSCWAYKIEDYVTDGPGYAGELYVIVWGFPNAVTTLERTEDGSFHAYDLGD